MSIPAQGAVGAETMTVRADIFRNLLEAARPFYACVFNDNGDVSVSTGHITIDNWLRLDRAFHAASEPAALASPRADSDERTAFRPGDLVRNARYDHRDAYPAFGESAYVQAVDGDYLDFGQGSKLLDSLFDLATPAQPAGAVPDSLRALSEAAGPGKFKVVRGLHDYAVVAEASDRKGSLNSVDADFAAASANFVRSLLASHPAGQSAGSGADADLAALAEAASVPERAYGILWRLTAFDTGQIGYAHDARKVLLAAMDKEGQRRGIAWATRQYGPLGPNPRFMLSDEDRMEMGL